MVFIRKKEDFTCEFCGNEVVGNGFTNHCPVCLYSKHVDIDPGDRAERCSGLMKPIRIEGTQKKYLIVLKCVLCGFERKNSVHKEDSIDKILEIIKTASN
jgi:hypothetical protein